MHRSAFVLLALAATLVGPGDEPKARFRLHVGDRELVVASGEPFDFDFGAGLVRCTITQEPTRLLELGTLRVEYPEGLGFDHRASANSEAWTLDALDGSAEIHRMPASLGTEAGLDSLMRGFVAKVGADGSVERVALRDGKWAGRRIRYAHGPSGAEREVCWYLLGRSGSDAWFFTTGHSQKLSAAEAAQWTALVATVERTLELGPKPAGAGGAKGR